MFSLRNYTDDTGIEQPSISALYVDDFKDRGTLAYMRGIDPREDVVIRLHDNFVSVYRDLEEEGQEVTFDIYGQDTVRLVFVPFEYSHGDETDAETAYVDFKLIDGVWKKYDAAGGEECSN